MEEYNRTYIATHYPVAQEPAMVNSYSSTSCSSESDHSYTGAGGHRYGNMSHSVTTYPSIHYHPYGQRAAATSMSSFPSSDFRTQTVYPQISSSGYDFASHYIPGYMKEPVLPRLVPLEEQDTPDEKLLMSERVTPAYEGFPDADEFDNVIASYIEELSVKKRDKALIHAKRARNIRSVLERPKDTTIESAQFRFWAKKMFSLETRDEVSYICHHGKPVAIREKIFKILTEAHKRCAHGGRDKTSQEIRQVYSWIPKELISRFVKICPTCRVRRGGGHYSAVTPRDDTPPSAHLRNALLPRGLPTPRGRVSPIMNQPAFATGSPRSAGWWSVDSLHAGPQYYPHMHQQQQPAQPVRPVRGYINRTLSLTENREGSFSASPRFLREPYSPTGAAGPLNGI